MTSNSRHGLPPRLMAHQPTRFATAQESKPSPSPGIRIIRTPADGVGVGFSGIGNADRRKRHEWGGRTMAHVADHLSVSALEQPYRPCTDVTAARQVQTIWLLAKGHDLAQV